ncbi:ABC transporter ATP-binding protein [Cellulomonas sp. zg-ZUI222]|uniref:ABC transporter ATP-binding protein n=1 Tax=Cellulomonas wangleii TaxID=2816956 RepID=A0ABX8D759_9CELL|nr:MULTISPECIES: ABC transporter ATP-binding protein [Cellulomonas]MBO0901596.1 ABC transporter ATP-binding protein [Cellulomonas sp. zg-ZUI22]MBO0922285.1 ABC transporter ATP-binding protein [Cellulomonas wangleii]MBO0925980.1 ABC transporter ATP-binding protein [Cellulomonas wangleii]QVI63278.1 ABC transporter ATP-binding protein [Cellulomonas wangleii]
MTVTTDAGTTPSDDRVLSFEGLDVRFSTEFGSVHAVKGISLDVRPGEVVALVGESGSGKSVTSMTALGLLPKNARVGGNVEVAGKSVGSLDSRGLRRLRGNDVAMVFQEPMTALNPVLTIGLQMSEALELHGIAYGRAALDRAVELLRMVGIPEPERRIKQYPHELSGGQRQRVVIALAISCNPRVIIADEPTTALDVTVQADILDLLRSLKDQLDTGILLITHNMGVVADMADRVAVMFKGEIVERGTVDEVLNRPQHPYTRRLLEAVPHLGRGPGQFGTSRHAAESVDTTSAPALEVKNVVIEYQRTGKPPFRAVDDVSFDVRQGEVVGLVGESGSGKSTLGRAALGLIEPAAGEISLFGDRFTGMNAKASKRLRRRIGVIFQDPAASLNPRLPIGDVISEPMIVHGVGDRRSRQKTVYELLDAVHLPRSVFNRYPHELSGGQRQRVSVARALTLEPELLVADEPTSALDVSVQASVLAMFTELQERYKFACLFVSHDLAVVDLLAHRVVVLRDGKIVEQGDREQVLQHPREEYTQRLLAAAPVPEPGEQRRRREERHRLLESLGDEVTALQVDPAREHGPLDDSTRE